MKAEKRAFALATASAIGISYLEVEPLIEYPPTLEMGDLALPCFRFAKQLHKSPQEIAAWITASINQSENEGLEGASSVGGYVNVKLSRQRVVSNVVRRVGLGLNTYFSSKRGMNQRVVVDYSSPNIAKPFGVGHLRSTMIGQAIARMLREDGYDVISVNHLGDWGTQFGKNIVAYLKWGVEDAVRRDSVKELFNLYVRFHEEAQQNPELDDEARAWFKKLEDGDNEAVRLWKWFIAESLKAFRQTYDLLGVSFDYYLGESFYNDKMQAVVDELEQRALLKHSDGAEVVDLSTWDVPPCIIRKSDGATIYATRDLAAALYRHDVLEAEHLIYVVGSEQNLHFAQVFRVLDLMGRSWAKNCRHVAFGMMRYNGERLSTRRGKVVYLEDVLDRAIVEAKSIIEQKNPTLPDKDRIARQVGIGAVVFNDLKNNRMNDVDFRFEDVLTFDGETGPYVQYTHARACSVLRKAAESGTMKSDSSKLSDHVEDLEWHLVHHLAQAQEIFERAVDDMDPSMLARFVLNLCHRFNRFYHECKIMVSDDSLRIRRLALTDVSQKVIGHCLYLLGLDAPEAM